jgi:hypothetical protein
VYRTAQRRTVTVPFRDYVEKVMAAEWGSSHPTAALRIGAVAVKQFAWYYAINWRGGRDAAGRCYDVRDSGVDQIYEPSRSVTSKHRAAVAATWSVSLRKGSRFFLTGYRPGTGVCDANRDGWKLYQRDATDCVRDYDWTAEKLARYFFSSVSWITPGIGDWSGDGRGDLATLSTDPESGATTGRVHTTDATYRAAVAGGALAGAILTTAAVHDVHGRAAGDVTGDGRRDVVQLVETADGAELQVIRSTATGLQPATSWWAESEDDVVLGEGELRLVVADFSGDGRDDAAIVRLATGGSPGTVVFLAASSGTAFADLRKTWTSPVDLTAAELLAGDVNGDGLADLVAMAPNLAGGTDLRVVRSKSTRFLGTMATWASDPLPPESLQAMIGDANRDGRSDVIVARRSGAGVRLASYRSASSGTGFSRVYLTPTLDLPFDGTRFASSDVDADGWADVYALVDRATGDEGEVLGTEVWRLLSSTSETLVATRWQTYPTLEWATAEPY